MKFALFFNELLAKLLTLVKYSVNIRDGKKIAINIMINKKDD